MSNTSYTTTASLNIPPELRALDQWLAYRAVPKPNGKINKKPIDAKTRRDGSSTERATWSTYDLAAKRSPVGAGFVLTNEDPYFAIDLDDCVDPKSDEVSPWAQAIVDRIPTYWEVSFSGAGLRGLGRGVKPGDRCRTGNIEVYDDERFVVMTGRTLPGCETIRNCQQQLTSWYHETFPPESPRTAAPPASLTLEDQDVIDCLRLQNDGGMASRLLDGDLCGFPSASESRFSLANRVSFYSDNVDQVARILRGSDAWSADERDRDRDRKASHDARQAIASYSGERFSSGSAPMFADRQPAGNQPDASEGDSCSAQLAEARREIAALKRDRDVLIALVLNPHVSVTEKMAVAATIDRATRTPAGEDGFVTIKPAEIANDWRPKPERGQNTTPLNRDGSKPRMPRATVRKTMLTLTQYGLNAHSKKEDVKPKGAGREPYKETVWRVRPPANMAEFLAPIAMYQPATITPRKARTIAPQCSECGVDLDVTTWTVTEMACPECGEVHRAESVPRTVHPVTVIDPQDQKDNLSPVRGVFTMGDKLSPIGPPDSDAPPDGWALPYPGQPGRDRWTS